MSSESTVPSTATPSEPKGRRHPTLYFADGDVVLSSDSAHGHNTTFYRVDKLYLSRQSVVFQEMFGMPMNPSPDEMYDGVAWVRMPDSTQELEPLLSAIYNPASLSLKRRHPDTALRLSGAMKTSKKYEVEPIRRLILEHIEADWPQNVDEWDNFTKDMKEALAQHLDRRPPHEYGGRSIHERFPEAGSALRFALDNNCTSILPAVSMCIISGSEDWDSTMSALRQNKKPESTRTIHFPHIRWEILNKHDLSCLERGRSALEGISKQIRDSKTLVISGRQTCKQCSTNLQVWRMQEMSQFASQRSSDPILFLKELLESGRPNAVCEACWDGAWRAMQTMRQKIWDELPATFGWQTRVSA